MINYIKGDATIINGDVLKVLQSMSSESVQCVVTSPPYWGLRDYNVEGMIGLEPTLDEFLAKMVEVFAEVKRVLRKDGTVWLNMGDGYAGPSSRASNNGRSGFGNKREAVVNKGAGVFKTKDLMLMPSRLAIALQDNGWWIRSEIIWHKPNSMPESCTDRPSSSHEKIYLLTKSSKYFYDADAVRENNHDTYNGQRGNSTTRKKMQSKMRTKTTQDQMDYYSTHGRNLRNVWKIPTQPYKNAHFATFPEALPMKCIMAGTSEKGCCSKCGTPLKRITEKKRIRRDEFKKTDPRYRPSKYNGAYEGINGKGDAGYSSSKTLGWEPDCECNAETKPCTVLDIFSGAATTGLVALKLQRKYIGIELNPDYVAMSLKRIEKEATQEKLF